MTELPKLTVYYDGACLLCAKEIGLYRGYRGAESVAWVDAAQSAPAAAFAPGLTREAALARFHVRDAQGRLVSGAAAFVALWSALPGWRWAGAIGSLAPIAWLLERVRHQNIWDRWGCKSVEGWPHLVG